MGRPGGFQGRYMNYCTCRSLAVPAKAGSHKHMKCWWEASYSPSQVDIFFRLLPVQASQPIDATREADEVRNPFAIQSSDEQDKCLVGLRENHVKSLSHLAHHTFLIMARIHALSLGALATNSCFKFCYIVFQPPACTDTQVHVFHFVPASLVKKEGGGKSPKLKVLPPHLLVQQCQHQGMYLLGQSPNVVTKACRANKLRACSLRFCLQPQAVL
eukprot:1056082-Pelagomonas_calceolata.AAC.2